jgi:hypothetical protein
MKMTKDEARDYMLLYEWLINLVDMWNEPDDEVNDAGNRLLVTAREVLSDAN